MTIASRTRVSLGDVLRNVNEVVSDPSSAGIDRVIGLEHLDAAELTIRRWGTTAEETTFTRRVRPGQTLFGKRRAYQRKTAYAEFDAICSGDILVFESLDPSRLLPELVPFLLSTDSFYAHALETSAGSLSPRTRWKDLAKFEFHLPPIEEQRRIAALLWAVEASRDKAGAQAVSLAGLGRAILRDHSIGASTWQTVPLPEVLEFREGPGIMANDFRDSGVPLLRLAGLKSGSTLLVGCNFLDPTMVEKRWAQFRVRLGDVLLSTSASLGEVAIVDELAVGAIPYTGIISFRPHGERVLPEFIPSALSAPSFRAQVESMGVGSVMKHFGPMHLRQMTIDIPSPAEQSKIVERLEEVGAEAKRSMVQAGASQALQRQLLASLLEGTGVSA